MSESITSSKTEKTYTQHSQDLFVETFRSVIASAPIILYAMDQFGVFTFSEGAGLRKLGLMPGEAVGRSALVMYKEYPEVIAAIHQALAGEHVFFTHGVGKTFFDNRMAPQWNDEGQVVGLVGAAVDVTSLKEKETRLQQSHDELTSVYEELTATEEELRAQYDETLQVNRQVMKQNTFLTTLEEVTLGLLNELDMEQLLQNIVIRAGQIVGAEDSFIALPTADGHNLKIEAGTGIYQEYIRSLPLNWGVIGKVYASGEPQLIIDYPSWEGKPTNAPFLANVQSVFAVPLHTSNKVAGVLGVALRKGGQVFSEDQLELLKRFAELASLLLQNAALHASLQQELTERTRGETTLSEIFNGVNEVIIVNDPDTGEILWVNHCATRVFGYSEQEIKELGIAVIAGPANVEMALRYMRKAVEEGPQFYERETTHKNGHRVLVEVNAKRAAIYGRTLCLTVMRDITAKRQTERELLKMETEKQAVLEAIPDTMLIFNQSGVLQDFKKARDFETDQFLYHHSIGQPITEQGLPEVIAETYLQCITQVLETGKPQFYKYSLDIQGVTRYREVRFTKVNYCTVLALLRDTTEMRSSQEQVEFLRRHDAMTGVYDRAYFEQEIFRKDILADAVSIVVCDVDGLKLINDTLGHAAGDEVLQVVAAALQETFSAERDVVARIGGDEFAVIAYGADKTSVETAMDTFMQFIQQYCDSNPQLPISVSMGWAVGADGCLNMHELFKEADNAMYRQKLHQSQSMRSSIVQTMMKALEARDYITEGHADRLQQLVEHMGKRLNLTRARIADLRLFAQFHDIGKVGIPDYILNKPGKLTDEEYTIMKRHSDIGYRIALASPDLSPIADLILKHHEWWGGTGYPLRLAGEDIPLECRILALADSYDAMTNDRPYRKALSRKAAIEEIYRCRGSQFDPGLVNVFMEILEQEKF